MCGLCLRCPSCCKDIYFQPHQFRRQLRQAFGFPLGKAPFDHEVLANNIIQFAQTLDKRTIDKIRIDKIDMPKIEEANAPDFALRLRECRKRRECASAVSD